MYINIKHRFLLNSIGDWNHDHVIGTRFSVQYMRLLFVLIIFSFVNLFACMLAAYTNK